jgi:hypothetical protein
MSMLKLGFTGFEGLPQTDLQETIRSLSKTILLKLKTALHESKKQTLNGALKIS